MGGWEDELVDAARDYLRAADDWGSHRCPVQQDRLRRAVEAAEVARGDRNPPDHPRPFGYAHGLSLEAYDQFISLLRWNISDGGRREASR